MLKDKIILVTGGAGFIGSTVIRHLLSSDVKQVINIDKLTYAGWKKTLEDVSDNSKYYFECADICDTKAVERVLFYYQPDIVMNLAAESHVDRSITSPNSFIQTNIVGTSVLLNQVLMYWKTLDGKKRSDFLFHQVSTDEVFGDIEPNASPVSEKAAYSPSSPYSASKAGSDHLVKAWYRTYGLPIIISHCSNNYGPYQLPEKLIPLVLFKALQNEVLPIYGDGGQSRDWLYVDDHVLGLLACLSNGEVGESYNFGSAEERSNLSVVESICCLLNELRPTSQPYQNLITFVSDRPGHDRRYAVNIEKSQSKLDWSPLHSFDTGLRKTVNWYLNNEAWCQYVMSNVRE